MSSAAHHAQPDGQTEGTNKSLEQILRSFVHQSQTKLDSLFPMTEFAYNDTVNASTKLTPFQIENL